MKTCSKCGFCGENELFEKIGNVCKKCKKEYRKEYHLKNKEKQNEKSKKYHESHKNEIHGRQKEYRENNKEKIKKKKQEYCENNKEKIKKRVKKYLDANKEQLKENRKAYDLKNKDRIIAYRKIHHAEYYEKNKDKIKERVKQFCIDNKEHVRVYKKDHRIRNIDSIREKRRLYNEIHKEKIKEYMAEYLKKYSKTQGGRVVNCRRSAKRRHLGHDPINSWFPGSEAHHLRYTNGLENKNNDITIYAPKELHRSIRHNGNTGQGMKEINCLILEWYLNNTPPEEQNKNAVDLYLKYCMMPEPVWISEHDATTCT